jgi:hypothetical protein
MQCNLVSFLLICSSSTTLENEKPADLATMVQKSNERSKNKEQQHNRYAVEGIQERRALVLNSEKPCYIFKNIFVGKAGLARLKLVLS